MPRLRILLASLLLVGAGAASVARCQAQCACVPQTPVILVRGLVGYWPGIGDLEEQFHQSGFATRAVIGHLNADLEAIRLAARYKSGRARGPIILVGYSLGGNDVVRMAKHLDARGVCVDLLVIIEAPYRATVPSNVRRCLNLYQARPNTDWLPWFRGMPMDCQCTHVALGNHDLSYHSPGHFDGENHFIICANRQVHKMVVNFIVRCTRAICPAPQCEELTRGNSRGDNLPGSLSSGPERVENPISERTEGQQDDAKHQNQAAIDLGDGHSGSQLTHLVGP